MKKLIALLVVIAAGLMVSCNLLTAEEAQSIMDVANQQLADGTLTPEAHAAVIAAAKAASNPSGATIIEHMMTGVGTLIAGYLGIRVWRGTPSARKGATPTT